MVTPKRTGFFSKIELDFIEGPAKKGGETPAVYLRSLELAPLSFRPSMSNTARGAAPYLKQFVSEIRKDLFQTRGFISCSESEGRDGRSRHQTAERIRAGHR